MDGPGSGKSLSSPCGPFRPTPTRHRPRRPGPCAPAGLANSCLANAARSSRLPLARQGRPFSQSPLTKQCHWPTTRLASALSAIAVQGLHGFGHGGIAGLEMLDFVVAGQHVAAELRVFRAMRGSCRQLGKPCAAASKSSRPTAAAASFKAVSHKLRAASGVIVVRQIAMR